MYSRYKWLAMTDKERKAYIMDMRASLEEALPYLVSYPITAASILIETSTIDPINQYEQVGAFDALFTSIGIVAALQLVEDNSAETANDTVGS